MRGESLPFSFSVTESLDRSLLAAVTTPVLCEPMVDSVVVTQAVVQSSRLGDEEAPFVAADNMVEFLRVHYRQAHRIPIDHAFVAAKS